VLLPADEPLGAELDEYDGGPDEAEDDPHPSADPGAGQPDGFRGFSEEV
jgi:hypothetical protein